MMAVLFLLSPLLLLLGTVAGQGELEVDRCLWLENATEGNFSVGTDPDNYQPNTTYLVTIKDDRNHSNSSRQLLLQALSPQNASVGHWEGADTGNCSSGLTAVLNITESRVNITARWTSPDSNLSSVHIRVYLILTDNSTELKTHILNRGAESTMSTPTSTPNSVCRAQSSSLLLLAVLLLLLTGTLLS